MHLGSQPAIWPSNGRRGDPVLPLPYHWLSSCHSLTCTWSKTFADTLEKPTAATSALVHSVSAILRGHSDACVQKCLYCCQRMSGTQSLAKTTPVEVAMFVAAQEPVAL